MVLAERHDLVRMQVGTVQVEGLLELPADPTGIVLFAYGSGSSRLSTRNNYVAAELRKARLGTLLIDLLTTNEDQDYQMRFDIGLLADRLNAAVDWLRQSDNTASLPIGLFGASTGAAAALQVASARGTAITAVVSRGGRPDMAGVQSLGKVCTPTLFIVGGFDVGVIELNQEAYSLLQCEKQFVIVPGATHLFEERGKLEAVAELASEWFVRHVARPQINLETAVDRSLLLGKPYGH